MIPWYWLIVAFVAGVVAGLLLVSAIQQWVYRWW